MGGLLNKKEKVIGPTTKIGLDANCPHCGKFFNKHSTYSEVNRHQDLCKVEKEKRHLETLMRDLKKSKHYLKEIDKINSRREEGGGGNSNFSKLNKHAKNNNNPHSNANVHSGSNPGSSSN